jgi:hypothetical protein
MTRLTTSFAAIVSLLLLCGPLVLAPFIGDINRRFVVDVEKRSMVVLPSLSSVGDLIDTDWWTSVSAWWRDRVPFRGDVIAAKARLDASVLRSQRIGGVDLSDDGWYFIRQSYGQHWADPGHQVDAAVESLDAFLNRSHNAKAKLRLLLTPDKHTIYPEHLTRAGLRDIQKNQADRRILESWFDRPEVSQIIDMHAALRSDKISQPHELYFRDDTHLSWYGAATMAEAIVDAIQPNVWNHDRTRHTESKHFTGDLCAFCGHVTDPTRPKDLLITYRPGAIPVAITVDDEPIADLETVDADTTGWQKSLHVRWRFEDGEPAILGRTLILHDSCIGSRARPLLRPYFEDITFIHNGDMTPELLEQAMQDYDTVVIEVVERVAPGTFIRLLAEPNPEAAALLWNRSGAEVVWSIQQSGTVEPRGDAVVTLTPPSMTIIATKTTDGVVMTGLDLEGGVRHVARTHIRAVGPGTAYLQWRDPQGLVQNQNATLRSGRNELYFTITSAGSLDTIELGFDSDEDRFEVESLEIRRIPEADEPPSQSQPGPA